MGQDWTSHQELTGGEVPVSRREQPEERLTRLELYEIAKTHRRLMQTWVLLLIFFCSILPVTLLCFVLELIHDEESGRTFGMVFGYTLVFLYLLISVWIFQLASLIRTDRGIGVLYILAIIFIPPLGPLMVFSLCTDAKKILKRHGLRVRFLGTNPKTIMAG